MYTNYHAHTERCHHAQGTEEAYILRAISAGFSEFGFSDHAPYFLDGFYSDYRMSSTELHDYVLTVARLRDKYADRIKIHIGLEIEYYPAHFNDNLSSILTESIDYLILGQHFTHNEYDGVYVLDPEAACSLELSRYVQQVTDAVKTGLFTYIAHPDIIRHDRVTASVYTTEMSKICIAAKRVGIPLEINLTGLVYGRTYPCTEFFQLAADHGNDVIIGFDSHSLDAVFSPSFEEGYHQAVEMTKKLGLHLLDHAKLIKPELI